MTTTKSGKRARSPNDFAFEHAVPKAKKRPQITPNSSINHIQDPAIPRTSSITRGETQLYASGTPISYKFHSCDTSLIREALHLIRTEDILLNLNLSTLTFSLPKHLDDDGLAIPWLVSLATCLAWCFHSVSVPDIVIMEPELGLEEPYIAVNEKELPTLRTDLYAGTAEARASTELSTTATDLVVSFLNFTHGLPRSEMETKEQVIFALADYLHNRPDKCKSCVLWRAAWRECLDRLYGQDVARSMVKQRKFRPACQ
jgi:hypothetical protein